MLVRVGSIALLLVVSACRAPDAPTSESPPAKAPRAEEPEGPATSPSAPAPTDHASPTDAILAAVLTHEQFAMYLHPDVPGRVPVIVSGAARPNAVSLELHGAAVISQPPEKLAAEQAFVDIERWSVEGDRANVVLAYEIEGVGASFRLEREASGRWVVTSADVAEH